MSQTLEPKRVPEGKIHASLGKDGLELHLGEDAFLLTEEQVAALHTLMDFNLERMAQERG
jgi:pyridoxine 5'-phosphate synthase PdxJ